MNGLGTFYRTFQDFREKVAQKTANMLPEKVELYKLTFNEVAESTKLLCTSPVFVLTGEPTMDLWKSTHLLLSKEFIFYSVSTFEMIQKGFYVPTYTLIRGMLEILEVLVFLRKFPKRTEEWAKGWPKGLTMKKIIDSLQDTADTPQEEKVFEGMRKIYIHLSKFVHPSLKSIYTVHVAGIPFKDQSSADEVVVQFLPEYKDVFAGAGLTYLLSLHQYYFIILLQLFPDEVRELGIEENLKKNINLIRDNIVSD